MTLAGGISARISKS